MESSALATDDLTVLEELLRVPGVLGSMLISADGGLLLEHFPAELGAGASDAAPRLAVLLDALSAGRSMRAFGLRFSEHRLHVLPVTSGFFCVLTELSSQTAVLKMAMNVVARRLG